MTIATENIKRGSILCATQLSIVPSYGNDTANSLGDELSSVEIEILTMLACGKSLAEISNFMSLSQHTAQIYLNVIREKLKATNSAHAVARAVKLNLISLAQIH